MSSLADSANGTIDTADASAGEGDGVVVDKVVTAAAPAPMAVTESVEFVKPGPELSEFVLRVSDRIAATRNKIRDCQTDIETQKGDKGSSKRLTCFFCVHQRSFIG